MTDVEIRVQGVSDARGRVRVAVCSEAQWLQFDQPRAASAPATAGQVVVTISGVPPGLYGVLAHHDANADGVINRDRLGRPTEGIGFSRDAPMLFGPPRFRHAAIQVDGDRVVVTVRLRFEPKTHPSQRS